MTGIRRGITLATAVGDEEMNQCAIPGALDDLAKIHKVPACYFEKHYTAVEYESLGPEGLIHGEDPAVIMTAENARTLLIQDAQRRLGAHYVIGIRTEKEGSFWRAKGLALMANEDYEKAIGNGRKTEMRMAAIPTIDELITALEA